MGSRTPQIKTGKKMLLQSVPEDVQAIIISRKVDESDLCACDRSQDYVIYKMLREHKQVFESAQPVLVVDGSFVEVSQYHMHIANEQISITCTIPVKEEAGMALTHKMRIKD